MPYLKEKTMKNRELKFRAWITPWGGDSQPYMKYIEDLQLHVYFGNWERGGYKDAVFQQYTGLKDSKGVEIYEGDFVKYNPDDRTIEREGIIEWSNYYHGWAIRDKQCYPESDYGVFSLASPFMSFNDVKIIGNIMQNPELIKKQ